MIVRCGLHLITYVFCKFLQLNFISVYWFYITLIMSSILCSQASYYTDQHSSIRNERSDFLHHHHHTPCQKLEVSIHHLALETNQK